MKGRNFTLQSLLTSSGAHGPGTTIPDISAFDNASIAIYRLAPADYHRFHSPADVIVGDIVDIPGSVFATCSLLHLFINFRYRQYYTVNPQAVNEPGFDVFTANRRAILYLTHEHTGKPIAFVAIGALLVGSIVWTVKKGDKVKKGQELGDWKNSISCMVI